MYAPPEATIALMHKTIDKILAELMAREGLNQARLSALTKVGQPTISRILKPNGPKGIKNPTDTQVRPIADHFRISTDQLRGYAPLDAAATQDSAAQAEPASAIALVKDMLARASKLPEGLKQRILATAEHGDNVIKVDFSRLARLGMRCGLPITTCAPPWVAGRSPMNTRKCSRTSGSARSTFARWGSGSRSTFI